MTTRGFVAVALLCLAAACTAQSVPYDEEISLSRAQKDAFMRGSEQSPVLPAQRAAFPPLAYFPVDPGYRIPAALKVNPTNDILEMPTSTGDRRRMRRIGTLGFTVKDQTLTLTAFVDATENDMRRLFVPFGDLTNGTETYTGGRYLDLDRTATGIYDLDFNRAYFPFCYYNPAYDCPVPPKENRLRLPVRAGERMEQSTSGRQPQSRWPNDSLPPQRNGGNGDSLVFLSRVSTRHAADATHDRGPRELPAQKDFSVSSVSLW